MAVTLIDGGSPVVERAKVVLSFRGAGWADGPISTSDVRRAFEAALASPYMSHLVQYREVRRAQIVFSLEDTRNLGSLGPDPRGFVSGNIWLLTDEDIRNVARVALRARPPEANEEVIYFAVVSQDPYRSSCRNRMRQAITASSSRTVLRSDTGCCCTSPRRPRRIHGTICRGYSLTNSSRPAPMRIPLRAFAYRSMEPSGNCAT